MGLRSMCRLPRSRWGASPALSLATRWSSRKRRSRSPTKRSSRGWRLARKPGRNSRGATKAAPPFSEPNRAPRARAARQCPRGRVATTADWGAEPPPRPIFGRGGSQRRTRTRHGSAPCGGRAGPRETRSPETGLTHRGSTRGSRHSKAEQSRSAREADPPPSATTSARPLSSDWRKALTNAQRPPPSPRRDGGCQNKGGATCKSRETYSCRAAACLGPSGGMGISKG
mmetsp:Transcript_50555/g.114851  ORF Transcript_50555/g.114851 Transcript_50555/m.114851 type:complete len:228 (-) Transcript_50555:259-942(-)